MREPLTDADRAQLVALWDEIGKPESAEPTSGQMLELIRRAPDELALRIIDRWRDAMDAGHHCWLRAHDSQLEHWQVRALTAEARLIPPVTGHG